MPIYAYRCSACGHAQDVLQKISDPVLTVCPACAAQTYAKQLTAAGFQLKGSGWYVTDFRGGANVAAKDGAKEGAEPAASDAPKEGAKDGAKEGAKEAAKDSAKDSNAPAAMPAKPAAAPVPATPAATAAKPVGGT